jgi:hypothetical protein
MPRRRAEGRRQRDHGDDDGRSDEDTRIPRTHCVQHGGHESRNYEGRGETDQRTDPGEGDAVANDQADDVGALRAEGDAHADLPSALLDAVRQHRENADGGEHDGERTE